MVVTRWHHGLKDIDADVYCAIVNCLGVCTDDIFNSYPELRQKHYTRCREGVNALLGKVAYDEVPESKFLVASLFAMVKPPFGEITAKYNSLALRSCLEELKLKCIKEEWTSVAVPDFVLQPVTDVFKDTPIRIIVWAG